MEFSPNQLSCDGCGLPADAVHIAERLRRLELATRFRPIHIGLLFVALAPPVHPEGDFYGLAESPQFFDPFLEALEIPSIPEETAVGSDGATARTARLAEFQKRGYYLAYLSECPLPENPELCAAVVSRLGPTLVRRIRFNYRPKHIVLLGAELDPLIAVLQEAGFGPVLGMDQGAALPVPRSGDPAAMERFRGALASVAQRDPLSPGYDRIQLTQSKRIGGAGGNT